MEFTLKIWRQKNQQSAGKFIQYLVKNVSDEISFLEMLDMLNQQITTAGTEEPVAFDSDCREGICGACGLVINGHAHGPKAGITTCQLHMRSFKDKQTIVIEPFRALAFPIIKDLVVDRQNFDKILQAGGYVSVNTGSAPEANAILVPKVASDAAMDAAQCIGCGACVAACVNASAMLFVGAKVSQLSLLPQGQPERKSRVLNMAKKMDSLGFGACTNEAECEAQCPKEIKVSNIGQLNREYLKAMFSSEKLI